ncbi:uncharacterized protein [Dysidea avara]|uniref:uncharacterized protein isoform X3 n=1 Tax=Dysidea avara TaxID=196820 RepID=UPI00331E9762
MTRSTSCINGLPESISLTDKDTVPTGAFMFFYNRFTCSGTITQISVGYKFTNGTGEGVYFQLRRETDNGDIIAAESIPLPIMNMNNSQFDSDGSYIQNIYNISLEFQQNDFVSFFIPSDSPVSVLVDRAGNSGSYVECKALGLRNCSSRAHHMGIVNTSLLRQLPRLGNPQIMIATVSCTEGFSMFRLIHTEETSAVTKALNSIHKVQGHYLYPDFYFHCNVKITRFRGLFVVNSSTTISSSVQLWRNISEQLSIALVVEFPLNFTADYSRCDDSQCAVDYQLPSELQIVTEIGDFVGFYSLNGSVNRPVFQSGSENDFYGYGSNCSLSKLPLPTNSSNSGFLSDTIPVSPLLFFDYVNIDKTSIPSPTTTREPSCYSMNLNRVSPTISNLSKHDKKSSNSTIIIVVSIASCLALAMIVIVSLIIYYKRKLKKSKRRVLTSGELSATYHRIVDHSPFTHYYHIDSDSHPGRFKHRNFKSRATSSTQISGSYVTISEVFDPYEVPFKVPCTDLDKISAQLCNVKVLPNSVELGTIIGSGNFGTVYHGVWNHDDQVEQVAVKMLNDGATEKDKIKLLKEAAIIEQFAHNNIVKLCGVVISEDPMMILLEYLSNGDLLSYLISIRPKEDEPIGQHIPQMLLGFARDVGRGMNYLSNKCFIHRDLAARNILLTEDNYCKIADFGMSRDLEDDKYYVTKGGFVPLKWTAPEALMFRTYTTASDVWSYGILLYEMWSLGHKPYEDYDNTEVLDMLESGYRLPPPPGCPRHIYCAMIQCWNPQHKLRPSFSNLIRVISQPSYVLFHWFEEDKQTAGPECDVVGAPIEAGHNLYPDLQNMYKL